MKTLRAMVPLLILMTAAGLGSCNAPRPAESIRANGDYLFERGDYAAAASEYRLIIERYPGDWQAQYMLGRATAATNELAESRRALEIAHTARPNDQAVADALAETMFLQGDKNNLYAFLRNRATQTQSVPMHLQMARYAQELGDPDSAQTALDVAIEIDQGRSALPYIKAADFAESLGDMELAVRRLRQAHGINPDDHQVLQRLLDLGEIPGPTLALPPGR